MANKSIPLSLAVVFLIFAGLFVAHRRSTQPPPSSKAVDLPEVPAYYYGRYYGEIVTSVYERAQKKRCLEPIPPPTHPPLVRRFLCDVCIAYIAKKVLLKLLLPATLAALDVTLTAAIYLLYAAIVALKRTRKLLGFPLCEV